MHRQPDQIRVFRHLPEEGQNPFIGFTSFQHFRCESLYSDVIVRPENNLTETEDLECFPIPDYVPQEGRSQGYYPDTTIAYIRLLWKEFEPREGEYHFEVIEDILDKANACGQTVMFRLLPHSTRACDDVPDWLKEKIPCPERPDGMRVKDSPRDPMYFECFARAIRKIAERFDGHPILNMVDTCVPGAWGEGHMLETYSQQELTRWVTLFTDAFHHTHLFGQVELPWLLNQIHPDHPIGWRADGVGNGKHMHELYPPQVRKVPDHWKTAPVSCESYWWLGEWYRKGWDLDEIIELTLQWHISSFNAKSLPIPMVWKDKIDYWVSKMGYHFAFDSFQFPGEAQADDGLGFVLSMENTGVAPIYDRLPLQIRIKNEETSFVFDTDTDIRQWLPGKHTEQFQIQLPHSIPSGVYQVQLGIVGKDLPVVYWGTDAPRDGCFYTLGQLNVL